MGQKKIIFGEHLRKLRKRGGLTTREVAECCGVAESTYREWEHGREIRGAAPYEALARVFQVSLWELMIGEEGKTSINEDLKHIEAIVRTIRLKLP